MIVTSPMITEAPTIGVARPGSATTRTLPQVARDYVLTSCKNLGDGSFEIEAEQSVLDAIAADPTYTVA